MSPPEDEILTFEEKLYVARINDRDAARYARDPQHGPLPDERTPDVWEEMGKLPEEDANGDSA